MILRRPPYAEGPLRLPLTIDWEDWWQLCLPGFQDASTFEDRLDRGTDLVLLLCAELDAKATFFCLADQGRRHPRLLRRITEAGHEVALHGREHSRACDLERETFRTWLREGRQQLEDLVGRSVEGFRAPEWSLRGQAEGYWEDVAEAGFRYDSSRAPLALLGHRHWPREVHRLGTLIEFPPPVAVFAGLDVPLWGWGQRLLPETWLRARLEGLAVREAWCPVVVHPWELDEGQPRLPRGTPLGHRLAHGAGVRGFGPRLRRLLRGFELVTLASHPALALSSNLGHRPTGAFSGPQRTGQERFAEVSA